MVKAKKYASSNRSTAKMVCRLCKEDHPLRFCKKFVSMTYEARLRVVLMYRHCSCCLAHNHERKDCRSKGKCRKCGSDHHSMLHDRSRDVTHGSQSKGPSPSQRSQSKGPSPPQRSQSQGPSSSQRATSKGPRPSENSNASQFEQWAPSAEQLRRHSPVVGPRPSRRSKSVARKSRRATKRTESVSPSQRSKRAKGPSTSHRAQSKGSSPSQRAQSKGPRSSQRAKSKGSKTPPSSTIAPPIVHMQRVIKLQPTAVVKLVANGKIAQVRALIDQCADASSISQNIVRHLKLRTTNLGGHEVCMLSLRANLDLNSTIETLAHVKPGLAQTTPLQSIDSRVRDNYTGISLADPEFFKSAPVELVLGVDVYAQAILKGVIGGTLGQPLGQSTIFGYILSGSYAA